MCKMQDGILNMSEFCCRSPTHGDKGGSQEAVHGVEALEGFVVGLYAEAFNAVVSLINR